jgi:hypothetical protein
VPVPWQHGSRRRTVRHSCSWCTVCVLAPSLVLGACGASSRTIIYPTDRLSCVLDVCMHLRLWAYLC